jgi:hypothetical protein
VGEHRVLEWFMEILPASWEIYIQPHLNGLRPDFVLLHPQRGIAVYEVKDWSLPGMDYFVRGQDTPQLMARRNGKTFALGRRDPVAAIDQYKREIYGLYIPSLPAKRGMGSIVAGIIFTNAPTDAVGDLLEPLRVARGHTEHARLYPVIGSDLVGDCSDRTLRTLLPSANQVDDRMDDRVASELRHWLVEPSFSREQRVPLARLMSKKQRAICRNANHRRLRRIKGPAGSGKSLVLAGRAVELAKEGKRVLIATFNITLINYLMDLAVQYAQSGLVRDQITALNFHYWCKRTAFLAGKDDEYDALWRGHVEDDPRLGAILSHDLPLCSQRWAAALADEDRWDAILVDEGQDFRVEWWQALQASLPRDGSGEAMLVADAQQNVYGIAPWTESEMKGTGFSGQWMTLDVSYRMSPALCRLASSYIDRFQPDVDPLRPVPAQGKLEYRTLLKWVQVGTVAPAAERCVDALLEILALSDDDPVAVADLVCIVDREEIGLEIVRLLRQKGVRVLHTFGQGNSAREVQGDSRRKKLAFYKGDARVKVTTVQSFKGWESRALVVQISNAADTKGLALAYVAITRLKLDDHGCYLTVVSSAPELRAYGATWPLPIERGHAASHTALATMRCSAALDPS